MHIVAAENHSRNDISLRNPNASSSPYATAVTIFKLNTTKFFQPNLMPLDVILRHTGVDAFNSLQAPFVAT